MYSFPYTPAKILALGPRFGLVLGLERRLLWLSGGRDLGDFRVSGRPCECMPDLDFTIRSDIPTKFEEYECEFAR